LYWDTDSVIYAQKVGEIPRVKAGEYVGDLTDK
jgi:hypothetical protein